MQEFAGTFGTIARPPAADRRHLLRCASTCAGDQRGSGDRRYGKTGAAPRPSAKMRSTMASVVVFSPGTFGLPRP